MTTNPSNLLYISASPNGDHSVSRTIAEEFLQGWKLANPTGKVIEKDLVTDTVPHLDSEAIYANYTPAEQQSPAMKAKLSYRLGLISELQEADEILVSAPLWNWSIPSVLKSYIDQIVMTGVLDGSTQGLAGKKMTFIVAQGGSYKEGTPKAGWDFATGCLELVAKALGATDVKTILAEFTLAGIAPGMDFLKDAKVTSIELAKAEAKERAA